MKQADQIALPLGYAPAHGRGDFLVSDSNRAAFVAATEDDSPFGPRFALSGPEGAGKTHLAAIWCARREAIRQALAELSETRLAQLHAASAIALEDADRLAELPCAARSKVERLFFHLLNVCTAEDIPLMITGRRPPARWPVRTADLASRLAALPHVAVQPPDDALLALILQKLFRDRGVTVGADVIEYLIRRMDRSFAAAERIVMRLDGLALAHRRTITRRLAADLFEEPERRDGGDAGG